MNAPRAIGFLLHPGEESSVVAAVEVAQRLGFTTWVTVEHPAADLREHAPTTALLVTIGGDGTFLLGARLAAPLGIPVLGANRGRLGFLTDVELTDLPAALEAFAAGRHQIQNRALLDVVISRDGLPDQRQLALNDVAVKAHGVSVTRLRVDADGELLGEFDCDGVVVATSTGSTAYALSAGGPPVDPRVRALVVVPLAPHAVITRAVIVPEMVVLQLRVEHGSAFVAADGQEVVELDGGEVRIEPGPELSLVRFPGSPTFLQRLREKVRFGQPLKELERPAPRLAEGASHGTP